MWIAQQAPRQPVYRVPDAGLNDGAGWSWFWLVVGIVVVLSALYWLVRNRRGPRASR